MLKVVQPGLEGRVIHAFVLSVATWGDGPEFIWIVYVPAMAPPTPTGLGLLAARDPEPAGGFYADNACSLSCGEVEEALAIHRRSSPVVYSQPSTLF